MTEQIQSKNAVRSKSMVFFVIALVAVVLAFSSGASALGMIFIVVAIGSFGFGAGCLMNSPCGIAHADQSK